MQLLFKKVLESLMCLCVNIASKTIIIALTSEDISIELTSDVI